MGRHRAAGHRPTPTTDSYRRPRPQQSPRRAARAAAQEAARAQARAERARRRVRRRARRSRHASLPLHERLLTLPWITFVLLALVAVAVVGVLRPTAFEARSTLTAATPTAAAEAAVALTSPELTERVEDQVELEPGWRGKVQIMVDRSTPESVVVVRAQAPDPRLAALAADTAAALVLEDDGRLGLTAAAVVPTRPVGGHRGWLWTLTGAAVLALAVVVERRHDRRQRAEEEQQADSAMSAAGVPGATTAPVASHASPRRAGHPVAAGGVR